VDQNVAKNDVQLEEAEAGIMIAKLFQRQRQRQRQEPME